MKIVQTYWSSSLQQQPLHNAGGWLSPEYHWLPYTSVRVVLNKALAAYPHDLWALAKIYAYSI